MVNLLITIDVQQNKVDLSRLKDILIVFIKQKWAKMESIKYANNKYHEKDDSS